MSDPTGGLSYLDYLDGLGSPAQRAEVERLMRDSIDASRIRRAVHSKRYLLVRGIVRGIVKIALVFLFLWLAQWWIILMWAGFGS